MSNPRPSQRFCAAQEAFRCCLCTTQWQPVFIFIISNLTFSIQSSLLPRWKKLSIPLTFPTPTAKREPPPLNLLAGPDIPPICAPFQQIPSLHNSWRMGHTRRGTTSPSTRGCPIYGRSQHLREIVSLAPSRQSSSRKTSGISFYFRRVNTPRRIRSQIWLCGFLLFCIPQLKISSIWRRVTVVAILKPNEM